MKRNPWEWLFLTLASTCLVIWAVMQLREAVTDGASVQPEPGTFIASADFTKLESPLGDSFQARQADGIRLASTIVPVAELTTSSFALAANSLTIDQVIAGGVTWRLDPQTISVKLPAANDVQFQGTFSGQAGSQIQISIDYESLPDPAPAEIIPSDPSWEYRLPQTLQAPARVTFSVVGGTAGRSIRLIPPDATVVTKPQVTGAINNRLRIDLSSTQPFRVFDRYLILRGRQLSADTDLAFLVLDQDKIYQEDARLVKLERAVDGIWHATLELPPMFDQAKQSGWIRIRADKRNSPFHAFVDETLSQFTIIRSASNELPAPTITTISNATDESVPLLPSKGDSYFHTNQRSLVVTGTQQLDPSNEVQYSDIAMLFYLGTATLEPSSFTIDDKGAWRATLTIPADGKFQFHAATSLGNQLVGRKSAAKPVSVDTRNPEVVNVAFNSSAGEVVVEFSEPIVKNDDSLTDIFVLKRGQDKRTLSTASLAQDSENRVTLKYADVTPEIYTFSIERPASIKDLAGNALVAMEPRQFPYLVGQDGQFVTRGVTVNTGKNVEFPEYTNRMNIEPGFNPGNHVETRVAHLYYYRDAHRVAQIINREVQSFNRAAVSMHEQLADKARQKADQATSDRQVKERKSIEAAQMSRRAEQELQQAEQRAQTAATEVVRASSDLSRLEQRLQGLAADAPERPTLESNANRLRAVIASLDGAVVAARNEANVLVAEVEQTRIQEADARERWNAAISVEDRAREEQFRREVAAAHADPDTYVAGKLSSEDPVRQVSISVIGEGMIQLRGPIRGINTIRTMINQIDSPVGQVRIGVHTAQINGEDGQRMEKVAGRIQRYIDHSRFLTMQSTEMLRTAILQVAATKAMEVPGLTQAERDQKYLHAFYGEDFIRELEAVDSEFLHTGNKLLSLHSMNSTSLASALFNMALAKNSVRLQIVELFDGMMSTNLPRAEHHYFEAGLTCDGKNRLFGEYCKREDFCLLSQNARFQSLRGFFQAEVVLDDTMTPVQREFVRLAQIFKSRLIVELELRQRIMERAVIEDKLGNYAEDLQVARTAEVDAQNKLREADRLLAEAQSKVRKATFGIKAVAKSIQQQSGDADRTAKQGVSLLQLHRNQIISELQNQSVDGLQSLVDEALAKSPQNKKLIDKLWQDYQKEQAKILNDLRSGGLPGTTANKIASARERAIANLTCLTTGLKEFVPSSRELDALYRLVTPGKNGEKDSGGEEFVFTMNREAGEFVSLKHEIKLKLKKVPAGTWTIEFTAGADVARHELKEKYQDAKELIEIINRFELWESHRNQLKDAEASLKEITSYPRGGNDDQLIDDLVRLGSAFEILKDIIQQISSVVEDIVGDIDQLVSALSDDDSDISAAFEDWIRVRDKITQSLGQQLKAKYDTLLGEATDGFDSLVQMNLEYELAERKAQAARRPLDHKKFLDMLIDEMEEKYIELLEGTRSYTANVDGYIKRLMTALDDDFNTQFYYPAFRQVRGASRDWAVQLGQIETTTILANNRAFAKVSPQATMEFDLPKRDILITEAIKGAKAVIDDVGALANDPTFVSLAQIKSGQPTATPGFGTTAGLATVRDVLPGLNGETAEQVLAQHGPGGTQFGSAMESLIPDPAIYKFETGTGFEIRPVLDPDGQSVVFDFHYMYTTNVREPVRADEKHLGRVKRHFIDTDVQLSNFELREVSRYTVALKAARTAQGVPLLQDIPVVGVLWRPLPSAESSLQQNIILAQSTIFPTLFDLMGLRWAPVVADLDPLRLSNEEFIVRNRKRYINNRVFDHSSSKVDEFLRIPEGERRMDLYRTQETLPHRHPTGYQGPGLNLQDSQLQEGYLPANRPESRPIPSTSPEGRLHGDQNAPSPPGLDVEPEFNSPQRPSLSHPRRFPGQSSRLRESHDPVGPASRMVQPEPGIRPASFAEPATATRIGLSNPALPRSRSETGSAPPILRRLPSVESKRVD